VNPTKSIRAARGPKVSLDPLRPYAVTVEPERTEAGAVEQVLTVFLTNSECPFTCLMCDLWTHTLDVPLTPGQILAQLDHAIQQADGARHIKLYNAGNFMDSRAIPVADRREIAQRLDGFDTVIVENHPRLCTQALAEFAAMLSGDLEVAMGLETVHPQVLPRLNKQMTLEDFSTAAERLLGWGISVRAFVLLGLPWVPSDEFVSWAVRSVDWARTAGCRVSAVIPTRAGNGVMDSLALLGHFTAPTLAQMEAVQTLALPLPGEGRCFVDLWDAGRFADCGDCREERIARIHRINLSQTLEPGIECSSCAHAN
jgi:radical SAM enzyme (TIGR01210 family)